MSTVRRVQPVPLTFDDTGFRREDPQTWVRPATGDLVVLNYFDLVPDLPASLDDLPKLRHDLAVLHGEDGCLIEAHVVDFGGVPALLRVIKVPLRDQPSGQMFMVVFTVPKATCSANLQIMCPERGMSGIREATLMAQLGPQNWFQQHPYASDLTSKLPYHAGDDARWDQQFPDHPLSRARAWAHQAIRTARVDPNFAAMPPFQPPPIDVGTTLKTAPIGIPVAGYLPFWLDQETVGYWQLDDPDGMLARLGAGQTSRCALDDDWRRECVLFDVNARTVWIMDRFANGDGGTGAQLVPGRLATFEQASAATTPQARVDAFRWVGQVYEQAAARGEALVVGPGGDRMYGRPRVFMTVTNQVSYLEASPAPVDAQVWRDQRRPDDPTGPESAQSISAPVTSPENVRAGGLLAGFVTETWPDVHALHLALSFKKLT